MAEQKCRSILVAEDNVDVRETVLEALLSEGYLAYGASNGRAALELLDTLPSPTLILLDLMMPVMDGWQFLEAQRKDARLASHQVVLMSAVNPKRSTNDTAHLNLNTRLAKPLSLERLWEVVEEFCLPPTQDDSLEKTPVVEIS